jgi:hypothetical protein
MQESIVVDAKISTLFWSTPMQASVLVNARINSGRRKNPFVDTTDRNITKRIRGINKRIRNIKRFRDIKRFHDIKHIRNIKR